MCDATSPTLLETARPSPAPRIRRFEDQAFGLFLHYGLYSLTGRGEWVQFHEEIPPEEYRRLAGRFTAEAFDGRSLARLARESGMRYACLTTRHHEGFSLYDTRGLSDFDVMRTPCGRDLVADFVEGCRAEGIAPFLYHTTLDWSWNSHRCDAPDFRRYLAYLRDSVEVLCRNYGPIAGLWFDGNWSRKDWDWEEDALYGLIRRWQPEAMIINNTGLGARGQVGHAELDTVTFEQGLPADAERPAQGKYLAREMCKTLNRHWGLARADFAYLGSREAIELLCACRKVGANLLLNVGPEADGSLGAYEAALLRKMGAWIEHQRPPIYRGRPAGAAGAGKDFLLREDGRLFFFVHDLPRRGSKHVVQGDGRMGWRALPGLTAPPRRARWRDDGTEMAIRPSPEGVGFEVECLGYPYGVNAVVRVAELEMAE